MFTKTAQIVEKRAAVEEHIKECIDEAREVRLNTWQAAVYESILECEWFWNEYL